MALSAKPYLQRITARFGGDVDRDRHPYNVPAVRELESISFHQDVTFFIGENGAGKSGGAERDPPTGAAGFAIHHRHAFAILPAYPNAKILLFDGAGITEVAYEDTEHFAITRDFLNHYPRRLRQLLEHG